MKVIINHVHKNQILGGWLVGDHLLLRDFELYEIIFKKARVVITLAMAMHLRNFGPYGIMYMNVYVVVKTVGMVMLLRDFEPYG
jgi:hypothetical protein